MKNSIKSEQLENIKWEQLIPDEMDKQLLKNLNESKYMSPTPIQQKTIPLLTSNKDVNVKALTGSGKTLAFLVPVISILLHERQKWNPQQIGAVILTPTRELAQQIFNVLANIIIDIPLKFVLFVGGKDISNDITNFENKGANIIIATPGRLEALLQSSTLILSNGSISSYLRYLEVLIFDEADRLLDMGFTESISTILKHIPKQRRTGLFSATRSDKLKDLMKAGLRNPIDVSLTDYDQQQHIEIDIPSTLMNYYQICTWNEKFNLLVNFLYNHKLNKIILFFATTNCVDYFGGTIKRLLSGTTNVFLLHGKMKKRKTDILKTFGELTKGILICSDLLARGIDIPNIDWVVQFEPPNRLNTYIHRIGRTARYGDTGNSLLYLTPDQDTFVHFLNINQQIHLKEYQDDTMVSGTHFVSLPNTMRDYSLCDRDMYIKGIKAYVSYVRFYQEHQLKHIFSVKELDLCDMATSFGLLHLPDMPELKKVNRRNFQSIKMDYDSIPFKDKNREKQRAKYLKHIKSMDILEKQNDDTTTTCDGKNVKKSKRLNTQSNNNNTLCSKRHKLTKIDIMELDDDNRLLKRLKKGKISKTALKDAFD